MHLIHSNYLIDKRDLLMALLEVTDLTTTFHLKAGVVQAVNGIDFLIEEGELVGLVGESGCGKSVSMRSILRIIPQPPGKIESGKILFKGKDLLSLKEDQMRNIRGKEIAMIFQDPMTSLNPVLTIGRQLTETMEEHLQLSNEMAKKRVIELLDLVGIPDPKACLDRYPYEFSGGMRQRAMIAMALSCSPSLLIADEPTTALDVTIQAQVTELVKSLQKDLGMAVIWITHDLGVVARLVERVKVMYAGYIVEKAPVEKLYSHPKHPYTRGLLASLPRLDEETSAELETIPGQPPNQLDLPKGCPFAERCSYQVEKCLEENPMLEEVEKDHYSACWEKDRL